MIGRRLLHLRICTCPKRDFESEEKNREKQLSKNVLKCGGGTPTAGKQQIVQSGKRKALWVLVSYSYLGLANWRKLFDFEFWRVYCVKFSSNVIVKILGVIRYVIAF